MNRTMRFTIASVIICALVLVIFFTSPMSPMNTSKIKPVIVTDPNGSGNSVSLNFKPARIVIVIRVNNTVIWINNDTVPHTGRSDIPEFDSGIMPPGASYTHTFTQPGVYTYHCDLHAWMRGIIVVRNAS